jgi:4-hydroxy-4-methyl-2-oxoglutarate aldolase
MGDCRPALAAADWTGRHRRKAKMIEEPPLLRINTARRRPSPAQIAAFRDTPTGFVVDAMFGRGALDAAISPMTGPEGCPRVAGPALTADSGPGDILAALAALRFIEQGDVVVSAFAGHQGCAAGGDRLLGMSRNAGAVGFVTDGPLRDYDGIRACGLPAWCTGLTPASPFASGPGSVGFGVQIGGQRVESGDMIVADGDGVVVVPFAEIDKVIAALATVRRLETELDAKVAAGLRIPPAIEAILDSDRTRHEG